MAARWAKRNAPRPIALWSGVVFLSAWLAAAAFAPVLAPYDPTAVGTLGSDTYRAPSAAHWLGTDEFGRDVWSRVVWGARVSLAIGAGVALLASTLGAAIGLWAGWKGGRTDAILMRAVDLLMSVPRTYWIVLVVGVLRPSLAVLLLVLACTGWMATARLVRAAVRAQARGPAVEAARALGLPPWRIALRHVLPQAAAPLLVSATAMVGQTILIENALSFLGLGVQVPTPSWGAMVEEGRKVFPDVWWVAVAPGVAITITVLACNLTGDALRDALDPRSLEAKWMT
jgi:peptide/nickel transport system permease protein